MRSLGCDDIRLVNLCFVVTIITKCCNHVIVLVNEICHSAISLNMPVPCLNIVLLIALATSADTPEIKQVRNQSDFLVKLSYFFFSFTIHQIQNCATDEIRENSRKKHV